MTGHRSFNELRGITTPERRLQNAAATRAMLHDMAPAELRVAREKTQDAMTMGLSLIGAMVSSVMYRVLCTAHS